MSGALDGVMIVDLTSVGMGPMATQLRASSAIPRVSSSVSVGSPVRK